jgi:sigma-B regulation protein RsbU (phosphoserine phosphatase)
MPLPVLASESTRALGEGGLPSGMFPGASYERHVVQLAPGDCVLFASDGIHELRNPEEIEFGRAGLKEVWAQCCRKSATESVEFLLNRVLAFSDGAPPHDDITVVVLKALR